MKNTKYWSRFLLLLIPSAVIIVGISVLFYSQMNKVILNNTLTSMSELAEHDMNSIQSFIETKWDELYHIQKRFSNYNSNRFSELQNYMVQETDISNFETLYLVAEDGTVYTDTHKTYTRDQLDIMQYFDGDTNRTVKHYDYMGNEGTSREMLLYAVRLENFTVDGKKFIALAGLSNINQIQDKMLIYSFSKGNEHRGYSSVVNPNGDYIVNIDRTTSPDHKQNMYEMLSRGEVPDEWSNDIIAQKLENHESFHFYYTDEAGIEKFLYFMPIQNTSWSFILVIRQQVFEEQSRAFIRLSMMLLIGVIIIVSAILLYLMISRSKIIRANAESKARSEFLSNMSHEIRTPLNGVVGLLYLMQTHISEPKVDFAQMKDWIDKAYSSTNYLISLVSDILDMSKIEAGKLNLVKEPFMLEPMLDSVQFMHHANFENHRIHFKLEKDITYPCIIGDETRIKQVLTNIVGNAIKFTPENGNITLSVKQTPCEDNQVSTIITCTDTGIGMSPQFLEHIWDSFTQEHNQHSDGMRGTGLGMAISKNFIDAMNGEITVKSKPGEGSSFTITLHSQIAEPLFTDSGESSAKNENLPSTQHKIRLLLAEDNKLNAEIMLRILRREGFDVSLARDGREAVNLFAASAPGEFDAILMDVQMPILDGCEATEQIRKLDREDADTILIFACTANTFKEDRDNAIASGMNDFLTKPIDVHVLLKKLKQKINK